MFTFYRPRIAICRNGADLLKNMTGLKIDTLKLKILGYDLLKAQSDPNLINLTQYSQPMIFVFGSVIIDIWRSYTKKLL